ncbi:MAG: peptidyl-prolyl cis-trans isomerase [Polymorphobacter sp.]
MTLGKLLREPLFHFLLLGLGLFLLYGQVSPGDAESKRITVSQARVDDMARQYQSLWGRPPVPAELAGLVDSYVRDEILYREGLAMGLGRDDAVIKRRIRQKLDLILEEEAAGATPTDAERQGFMNANPAGFVQPAVVSFDQLLFDPAKSSPEAVAAARAALAKGASPATFGVPSLLPPAVNAASLDVVARDFGAQFAGQLAALPVGQWTGPVASGFGVHLVRLTARTPPQLPALADVRAAVARDWESARRARTREASYAKMRADYDILIEAQLPRATAP